MSAMLEERRTLISGLREQILTVELNSFGIYRLMLEDIYDEQIKIIISCQQFYVDKLKMQMALFSKELYLYKS